MKKETTKVEINIYDADGEMCEGIGGHMDFDDVKEQMIIALRNDGIPVVRAVGKNKTNEAHKPECAVPSWEQPMTISIDWHGVHFVATGKYDDVMDAQAEFMQAMREHPTHVQKY